MARSTILIRTDSSLEQRLNAWRDKQEIPPSQSRAGELALREFLDRREFADEKGSDK